MSFRIDPKSRFDPNKKMGNFIFDLIRYASIPFQNDDEVGDVESRGAKMPSAWIAARHRAARERASAAQRKNKVRRILRSQSEYLHPGHRMYSVVSSQRTLGEATNRYLEWNILRTTLALERTMLSWERTTLSVLSFSYGILKTDNFLGTTPRWYDMVVGWVFAVTAVVIWFAGGHRPAKMLTVIATSDGVVHSKSKEQCIAVIQNNAKQFLIAISVLVTLILARFLVTTIRCTMIEVCAGHNKTRN